MPFCLLGAKVPRRFRSRERKLQGTKVPGSESSTHGTFAPGSKTTWEQKFQLPWDNTSRRPHVWKQWHLPHVRTDAKTLAMFHDGIGVSGDVTSSPGHLDPELSFMLSRVSCGPHSLHSYSQFSTLA